MEFKPIRVELYAMPPPQEPCPMPVPEPMPGVPIYGCTADVFGRLGTIPINHYYRKVLLGGKSKLARSHLNEIQNHTLDALRYATAPQMVVENINPEEFYADLSFNKIWKVGFDPASGPEMTVYHHGALQAGKTTMAKLRHFQDHLDKEIPGWRHVYQTDAFKDWLNGKFSHRDAEYFFRCEDPYYVASVLKAYGHNQRRTAELQGMQHTGIWYDEAAEIGKEKAYRALAERGLLNSSMAADTAKQAVTTAQEKLDAELKRIMEEGPGEPGELKGLS